jgi:hypothetical protein
MIVSISCQLNNWKRGAAFVARSFLVAVSLPASATAFAMEMPEEAQIHGFLSQGLISTSHNNFFGSSQNSVSSKFTELGINFSFRPNPDCQVSAQLVSRRAGETDNGDVRLDYGFVDYTITSGESGRLGIQAGKIKNPFGFYNTTRDVAFTRPSILLPQSIYFDRARNFALSAPGVGLYGEHLGERGDVSANFVVMQPELEDSGTEYAFLGNDWPGELKGRMSYVGRLQYETDRGRLRFALTHADLDMAYHPGPGDVLTAGRVRFQPWVLSAQHNAERWSLTAEYALERVARSAFGNPLLDTSAWTEQFYLQGIYRFTPRWEGLVRYDVLYLDRNDRDGSKAAALPGAGPAYSNFAKDWTVGVRYDVTSALMLRAELHSVNGTAWLPTEDNLGQATRQHWNMLLFQASYRF